MIVVDASWLVDWLLGRPEAIAALESEATTRDEPLHAPELIEPETLSALRRLVTAAVLTPQRADQALSDLGELRLLRYPHAPLRARVWQLKDELSAYDATYLALAESVSESRLLTGDSGLAAVARKHLSPGAVREI